MSLSLASHALSLGCIAINEILFPDQFPLHSASFKSQGSNFLSLSHLLKTNYFGEPTSLDYKWDVGCEYMSSLQPPISDLPRSPFFTLKYCTPSVNIKKSLFGGYCAILRPLLSHGVD